MVEMQEVGSSDMPIAILIITNALGIFHETNGEVCARISAALDSPRSVSVLEDWYNGIPKNNNNKLYIKDTEYEVIKRLKDNSYGNFVPGSYRMKLSINRSAVNLRGWANVGARFDSEGNLTSLYIGDNRFAFFVFRVNLKDDISDIAVKKTKSGSLGVYCSRGAQAD